MSNDEPGPTREPVPASFLSFMFLSARFRVRSRAQRSKLAASPIRSRHFCTTDFFVRSYRSGVTVMQR